MPSLWIEASMVCLSDSLVINNVATLEVVKIDNFVGYVWLTNAEGDTFVYPANEVINVICEYESPEYDYYDEAYYEYEREYEREWMENEARYSEERDLFFQVSHIEPTILDGWFSG